MTKLKIRIKRPWVAYPGSTLQQNYAEAEDHGYLLWTIKDRNDFCVDFRKLPNPRPFVTIDWTGDVESTIKHVTDYPSGTRFRVKSDKHMSQKDVAALTTRLKHDFEATEVTLRQEHVPSTSLDTGTAKLVREDLRNPEILMTLLKDYYAGVNVTDEEWEVVSDLVSEYVANIGQDALQRNTKWSIKSHSFDYLYNYDEGNLINFEKLSGIVGIFGPNRSGKSSIVGTLMYAFFNTSDRGNLKNKDICNTRRPYCRSKSVVSVGGVDYELERQTVKQELKHGEIYAPTMLNLTRIDPDGTRHDLNGEARPDTEKIIRNVLGTAEDFTLTSLSAQGDINLYIQQGSTKRRQALSRLLDLDVCWKIFDQAKQDVNSEKALLRQLPDRDWSKLFADKASQIVDVDNTLATIQRDVQAHRCDIETKRAQLAEMDDYDPASEDQITAQGQIVDDLTKKVLVLQKKLETLVSSLEGDSQRLKGIDEALRQHDIVDLRHRYDTWQRLSTSVMSLKVAAEHERESLKRQERSLKILDQVPCGDSFPTCRFIKDAHATKVVIDDQRIKLRNAEDDLRKVQESLDALDASAKLADTINKLEKLQAHSNTLRLNLSENNVKKIQVASELSIANTSLESARIKLFELENSRSGDDTLVRLLRKEIKQLEEKIDRAHVDQLDAASKKGRYESELDGLCEEKQRRLATLQKLKAYEIVANGFSKKGIPNIIVSSQLPVINAEIAKILTGITDYTVEMECEGDSERVEIYINYGDSRRPIELGSGMEKFIASIAMRVAMINVSTLPKPDMFIIDEGFGSLDDSGIEACNRLLMALRDYFRIIVVITHVDAIKDTADHIIEIIKQEKESKVYFD